MTKEMWIEQNRDALEKAYHELYMLYLKGEATLEEFEKYDASLVALGILEGDQEEEEAEETFDWDGFMLDLAIEESRDRYYAMQA